MIHTIRERFIEWLLFGPRTITCVHCAEEIDVGMSKTRYIVAEHDECPVMVVDMATGNTYDEHLTGGL